MSSSYEKRLDEVKSRLERLTHFKVNEQTLYPDEKVHTINNYSSAGDYGDGVNKDIEYVKAFLLDVLKIKDPKRQKLFLSGVLEKIESLSFIDKKELHSRYAKEIRMGNEWLEKIGDVFEDDFKADRIDSEMRWGYEVYQAIGVYLGIEKRLKEVVGDVLDRGGYFKSSTGQLEGPYGTDELKKRFFSTRFDNKQLGLFIFLCEDAGIFKTVKGKSKKSKADLADMFAENFLNEKRDHFSKGSIKNQITDKHIASTRDAVEEVLETMLKKIHKL